MAPPGFEPVVQPRPRFVSLSRSHNAAIPRTPGARRARLFVFTLGYSRKSVRLLTFESSTRRWAELHEDAKPLPSQDLPASDLRNAAQRLEPGGTNALMDDARLTPSPRYGNLIARDEDLQSAHHSSASPKARVSLPLSH
jgi:hypothetical protein